MWETPTRKTLRTLCPPPSSGDPSGLPKHADSGARSANQSPQSVGSSGADSGVESTSDGLRDLPSIAISLCGGLSDNREITKGTGLGAGLRAKGALSWPLVRTSRSLVFCTPVSGRSHFVWLVPARGTRRLALGWPEVLLFTRGFGQQQGPASRVSRVCSACCVSSPHVSPAGLGTCILVGGGAPRPQCIGGVRVTVVRTPPADPG